MNCPTKIQPTVEIIIYSLIEPGTEHSPDPYLRYVGQTDQGLHLRLSQHIADAKSGRMGNEALRDWILRLLRRRQRPEIIPIETCTSYVSADIAEKHHITRCAALYSGLLNLRSNNQRSQARPFTENYLQKVI